MAILPAPRQPRSRLPGRVRVAAATVAVLVGTGGVPAAAGPVPGPTDRTGPVGKIEAELARALDAGGSPFWIRFADQADLSEASQIEDWAARGAAVAAELRGTAAASQAGVVRDLVSRGVDHQAFWATNAIYVSGGGQALVAALAARAEVEGLYAPRRYQLVEPAPGVAGHLLEPIPWGIANVRADQVWEQFGVQGDHITVANLDTGVQYDHPALVRQYRGNLGDGTFDHNYHWFDAGGRCEGDAPCDWHGHGTHTMGTMVGDDGVDHRIGVAPAASWIATNGCCSESDLLASAQWLLEPTDLSGANPDASKRPHIINNSWGTTRPSNDPFMEDVLTAWAASGILGVWANGNSGPDCETSGSPGSRTLNYSVGAYDAENLIANFSSRGPGQDGETKPDISAPGVNVLSAVPGDSYESFSGTSMATPHVAGAVALLWSALPDLIGDLAATRALLDSTAIATDDSQCGGSSGANNVYGEGRLDAWALLDAAGADQVGAVAGQVTDAGTGAPLPRTTMTVTGEVDRVVTTGPDGTYRVALPPGTYQVSASRFGYQEESVEVSLVGAETVTADFPLVRLPHVTLSGVVGDGGERGWPLYAKVSMPGVPQATTFSDPYTGAYQLTLPANMTHELELDAQYPGYHPRTETVTLGGGDQSRDFALAVDRETCTAPGYELVPQLAEGFDEPAQPTGWTVVDNLGNGQVWRFDNPGGRDNLTGGDGGFAIIDSQFYGSGGTQDTMLVTPPVDLSGITDPVLRFRQDFNWVGLVPDEFGRVDVSVDGGDTWENLLHQDTGQVRGPDQFSQVVASAAGGADVRVRFHYGNAESERWWQVDDVVLGECRATGGGLVAGHVRDENTGAGVPAARIVTAHLEEPVRPVGTPDDPQREDGLFWFTAPAGTHPVTATGSGYVSRTEQVTVTAGEVAELDFVLPAGELTVTPPSVEAEVRRRGSAVETFTVTNTGSAPVELTLAERGGERTATTSGSAEPATGPQAGFEPDIESWVELPPFPAHEIAGTTAAYVNGNLYTFGGVLDGVESTAVFVLDPETRTWGRLGDMPGPGRVDAARGVIDGKVYLVGGFGAMDNATLIYDPVTDGWSTGAPLPGVARPGAGATVLDGQLYLVGGCTTDLVCAPERDAVHRYDPASDSWETLAPYPDPTSFMACGGIDGALYCAGGNRFSGTEFMFATRAAYRYDPVADSWDAVADLPTNLPVGIYEVVDGRLVVIGGSFSQNLAFAYDPATDGWSELPAPPTGGLGRAGSACGLFRIGGFSNQVERLTGFDNCHTDTDVPWLAVSPTTITLQPGQSIPVTVELEAPRQAPVTHRAAITITDDTPYSAPPVPVTMHVTRN